MDKNEKMRNIFDILDSNNMANHSPLTSATIHRIVSEIYSLFDDTPKPKLPEELLEDKQDAVHCNCLGQHLTLFYESERHRKAINKIIYYLRAQG